MLVALVAVALHALPSHPFAVGRDDGVEVVAHHAFGEVLALAALDDVLVDVGIGRKGVVLAHFLAAAVDEALAVRQPLHLLHAAEGTQRGFPLFALHGVERGLDLAAAEVAHEDVAVGVDPVVPVAVHQVVHNAARRFVEVGIDVGHGLFQFHFLGEEHLGAVGRVEEPVDVVLLAGDALKARAVRVHFPHLHDVVFRGEEADFLAVGAPLRAVLAVVAYH